MKKRKLKVSKKQIKNNPSIILITIIILFLLFIVAFILFQSKNALAPLGTQNVTPTVYFNSRANSDPYSTLQSTTNFPSPSIAFNVKIKYAIPHGWQKSLFNSNVTLTSPDQQVTITIYPPDINDHRSQQEEINVLKHDDPRIIDVTAVTVAGYQAVKSSGSTNNSDAYEILRGDSAWTIGVGYPMNMTTNEKNNYNSDIETFLNSISFTN